MESILTPYISYAIVGVGTLVWYLLRQKDSKQEADIKLLWTKHDEDAKALQELRIQIAEGHYKKVELDVKFEKLEQTFAQGFRDLGGKFDKLSDALIAHMQKSDKG